MAQIVTRLDDTLVREVDRLVHDGVVESRSHAVRIGLEALIDRHRRSMIGARIVEGYTETPQSPDELAGLDDATARLIAEEPW
jgi:Arc/MetJ-type ribon-helix-helix transcriptional regulator